MLLKHIPNKGEHTVRYYGYYSNKSRGMRNSAAAEHMPAITIGLEHDEPISQKARAAWARLIKKIYEVDCHGGRP